MNRPSTLKPTLVRALAIVMLSWGCARDVQAAPPTRETSLCGNTFILQADLATSTAKVLLPDGKPLVSIPELGVLKFLNGPEHRLSQMEVQLDKANPLAATFTHPKAEVSVELKIDGNRLLFLATVQCKKGVVTFVGVPRACDIIGTPRTRLLWPQNMGIEFNETFLRSKAKLTSHYPSHSAFCDFCTAEVAGTSVYLYRSGRETKPRPAVLKMKCGDPLHFSRGLQTYLHEGDRWELPAFVIQVEGDLRETLLRYKRQCGLGKPLAEKMTPELFDRWKTMTHFTTEEPFSDKMKALGTLSLPAVVEPWGWMYGDFDRKFPDFLPPSRWQGGEEGFRRYIRTAHECGHLVRTYVNFTWWSTGWRRPDCTPTPSFVKYGDVALARRLDGKLARERYGEEFGYRLCPAHPVAIENRIEVRDALLDDYGVDLFYQDQIGARRWDYDLNPALKNPIDWGHVLTEKLREDVKRCPATTETPQDRVLDCAIGLVYWSGGTYRSQPWDAFQFWRRPKPDANQRTFPYALYLSAGDAVVQLSDTMPPIRLAWSLLLGGRLELNRWGPASWNHSAKYAFRGAENPPQYEAFGQADSVILEPRREAVLFQQLLAKALDGRTFVDRLVKFEYLAPRVARSTFENHSVVANFSDKPWPLEDGGKIAPEGFDLQMTDGLRAGRYVAPSGEAVLLLMDPTQKKTVALAKESCRVQIGKRIVDIDVPEVNKHIDGHKVGLLDLRPAVGAVMGGSQTADTLVKAFHALAPQPIRTLGDFAEATNTNRVIINSHSEYLPVGFLADWPEEINRLRKWIAGGGIWVEIGGYPLWKVTAPRGKSAMWDVKDIYRTGLAGLCGESCQLADVPHAALKLTAAGRKVLTDQTIEKLEGSKAQASRPPMRLKDTLVLCHSGDQAYLVVHPMGHGAVVRICGEPTDMATVALAEVVQAILDGRLDLAGPIRRTPVVCQGTLP